MKQTILVVDDDADILNLLEMRLSASGYHVVAASSGQQALSLFNMQAIGLVISDLRMPEMDGFALYTAIHQLNATVPFILLTAHGSIPEAVHATQQGVFSFLTKPFDSKVLLELVANAFKITPQYAISNHDDEAWRSSIISGSQQMQSLLAQAKLVAASDASVLIQGESGTGKELLAQSIHNASPRHADPFVAINCAAIPEALLESELFGHKKGAFTGATRDHQGLFQTANGGTLFLDEIGDMPMSIQAKLLRALQERLIRPVGGTNQIPINVRVLCATHKNLLEEMQEKRFREDLYYRINVVNLSIPSLAARREDIPLLANYFLANLNKKYHKKLNGFAPDALELMIAAPWPGNIRQLQNIIEQVVVLSTTPIVTSALVQKALQDNISSMISFDTARKNFEQQYLINLMKATQGNVTQAARIADRNRTEFYKILERHQINPALFKATVAND
ncbi:MAG TPA: sigma 54-interacting transcriptional regulator [Methylotenera sp.]|nr:sigma 54-interacting transcriptional regulator [Methylotenera sp.]HPH04284.1 sigma 54-interacting transcriptional regulator [Methylotenera sp.]HPM99838.1 sigma 54-interacting transcriptional regulator [Methylotenera sp.]